jgi:hypothetical protein
MRFLATSDSDMARGLRFGGAEKGEKADMLLTLLVILLLIALLGGGYGSSRGWGYYGWSPLGLLILIILILALTGNLSF